MSALRGGLKGSALVAVAMLAACVVAAPAAWGAGRCGAHPWCNTRLSPAQRADLLLSALTEDEKISLLAGDDIGGGLGFGGTGHTGYSQGVARVGLPDQYLSDGPLGPRQGSVTAMPSPLGLAATFSPPLARAHGAEVGAEVREKGNDVVFAPTVNVMRTPLGGRTFEAYGEDPFLVSRLTPAWIQGAQSQGVIATVKHYVANNQEGQDVTSQTGTPGFPIGVGAVGSRYYQDSIIDQRTLREVYFPQFEAAVKEGHVGIVMCSYNAVNGTHACESGFLLKQVLRHEWGFHGYVLSDYGAAHNTTANLNNGMDFEPWPPWSYRPEEVKAALAAGLVGPSTIDDHVRAIFRTLFAYGFFDRPAYANDDRQINKPAHAAVAQRVEESAITLLRNNGTLPLSTKRLRSIAVIGKPATKFVTGGGSGKVTPFFYSDPLDAIRQRAGRRVRVSYNDGTDSGAAAALARRSSVAIVFASDYYTEGSDRQCLSLECPDTGGDQDGLISAVGAANRRTIVVLESGGPDLTPWRGRVAALLEAWYPGERGGPAIGRVLFGDVDPSGRLPATFPASENDIPTAGDPEKYPGVGREVRYKEGVFVGYRWYDRRRSRPAFPFGFGLSYTRFALRGLRISRGGRGGAVVTVRVAVKNVGRRGGVAVPELYLGLPSLPGAPQPARQLKGFARVSVAPGRTGVATIALDGRAFSYWDTPSGGWRIARGCTRVSVASSESDAGLHGTIAQGGARCGRGAVAL